jgi:hypothetical protein
MNTVAAKDKIVLIVSSSLDAPHVEPVIERLNARGYTPLYYEADKVVKGVVPVQFEVGPKGLVVMYNNNYLDLSSVVAAWYRKPSIKAVETKDPGLRPYLEREVRGLQEIIWNALPSHKWLNPARTITEWDRRKISQLYLAQSMGFNIPHTIVANRWSSILKELPEKVVLKMALGTLYVKGEPRNLFSTVLSNSKDKLPIQTNPFPGIWQSYLAKKREWRVTIVGTKVFSVAIYTKKGAKDDWRKHQDTNRVTFVAEEIPRDLQEKCLRMLKRMGLRFGVFDFIEDEAGTITFLEINSNGQYLWLEQKLGLPISQAVTDELIDIAENKNDKAPVTDFEIMAP